MTIVAVTGGRHYSDREVVFRALDEIHYKTPITLLVQGFCSYWSEVCEAYIPRGADGLAIEWAEARGVPHTGDKYRADFKAFGRGAGPMRNRKMLKDEGVQKTCAFPGDDGTANCVKTARELGIEVLEVTQGK